MTQDSPLALVAILHARAGLEDELGRRLDELVVPTRAEPGCISYDLHRSKTDPAIWVLYEIWRSEADLQDHFAQDYLVRMLGDFDRLLAEDMQLHRLTRVSSPGR